MNPNHASSNPSDPSHTPADLAAISALLDRDALALGVLPTGAADRITAAAISAANTPARPTLRLTATEHAISVHQFRRITGPMRIAAAVLLALTAGVLTVAYLSSSTPATKDTTIAAALDPSQEADSILSALALFDSSSTELSALDNEADSISKSSGTDWLNLPESTDTGAL